MSMTSASSDSAVTCARVRSTAKPSSAWVKTASGWAPTDASSSATGPTGAKGDTGDQGDAGVAGLVSIIQDQVLASPGLVDVTAVCPSGKSVLSGGFAVSDEIDALNGGLSSGPFGATGWRLTGTSSIAQTVTAFAICATVAP